jgi:alpha/beta superfamily hydrolase
MIPAGQGLALEGAMAVPDQATAGVVVCHPHPRYGGDMDSPVVSTAIGACARQGLATLRFNFRGVGASTGAWDEGRGERADVRSAIGHLRRTLSKPARIALAGYSFGATMATAVAAGGEPLAGLALIAPPITAAGWERPDRLGVDGPLLVVAGSDDGYCTREALTTLAAAIPAATITVIDGADHFFSGGLTALDIALADWAAKLAR